MKSIIILSFFISLGITSFSQEGENPLPYVYQESLYDTAPSFPGGSNAMMKYFEDSMRYPEPEKTKNIQGHVMMKFDVTMEGRLINIKVVNGVAGGSNLAKESIRLLQEMPPWIPAIKNGKQVEAPYTLSIPFILKEQFNKSGDRKQE